MSSGKEGKEGKEGVVAKAAGAVVAVGVAWGIFRYVKAKKEEDALIQEYYGDREEFTVPDGDGNDYDADDVYIEEQIESVKVDPPPPPPVDFPPHSDELSTVPKEEIDASEKVEPPPPEPKKEEKPWFLRLFDPPKKSEGKPKFKESDSFDSRDFKPKESQSYEIKKGDTLWAISGKHGGVGVECFSLSSESMLVSCIFCISAKVYKGKTKSISHAFVKFQKVSLDALKAANGLQGDYIYAGDKLVIPPK